MAADDLRDWQPGDGLRCAYASRAPQGIPCGPPVKTRVTEQFAGPSRGKTWVRRPVCSHHVQRGFQAPSKLKAEADRIARQRLIHAHWEEYEKYLAEATAEAVAQYEKE